MLNQITGLIERGHHVDIYADRPGREPIIHPDVTQYGLLGKTHYSPRMPSNGGLRLLKALGLAATRCWSVPWLLARSLNGRRHGTQATSLKLFYRAIPFASQRASHDILHAHFGQNGLKASALRQIGAVQGKLITTFHGADMSLYLDKFGERVYDRLFEEGDLFLPISNRWKRRLIELGCAERKIIVHRMGIDCLRFKFQPRYSKPGQPVRLITIARLAEKKGVEYAIRAVARLRPHSMEYHIVGDGPLREDLQRLIEELQVANQVKLLGWKQQAEVIELLDQAHILIAPSVTARDGDQEGIPVALMEAMAMGLPIIATQHGGIPELVEDNRSGYLVPERDVPAIVEALTKVIAHPETWPALGQAGRAYVQTHYDVHKLNDRLVEIYERLLTDRAICV